MDLVTILREIDAVIRRLEAARALLSEVAQTAATKRRQPAAVEASDPSVASPAASPAASSDVPPAAAPPAVTIVPPRATRASRRTRKPLPPEARALGTAVSAAPVFVAKTAVPILEEQPAAEAQTDPHLLESLMRKNLLGGVA